VKLSKAFQALARTLQEADDSLSHSDICRTLSAGVSDAFPGQYCYVTDVYGDDESGDVVYCCHGSDYYRASYTISADGEKRSCSIDTENAVEVLPRTTYDEVDDGDEDDTPDADATAEAERFPGSKDWKYRPLRERFISKGERDSADDSSFAGSKRSFPILRKSDVMAAVRSIGRGVAGGQSAASLKSKIKAIAKRKGWTDALPKAWQDDDSSDGKEKYTWKPDGVLLTESSVFCEEPRLKEAATTDYPIKLISPGRGSSGYYSPDVLRQAAESGIFRAGTHMFWNHDTDQEESSRPEGDLNRLAAVTTSDATWDESGRDGPGLYARAKVFSDYADKVKEKGPHIGLSIRAGGTRDEAKRGPDGKPGVITALKNASSVDFVTRAGRDGKIFTESATALSQHEGEDMNKEEVQALIKESMAPLQAENKRLKEHLALQKAPHLIVESLASIRLPDASKRRIVERLAPAAPMNDAGAIDEKKLNELVEAEAVLEAEFLRSLGYNVGVASKGVRMTEAEIADAEKKAGKQLAEDFEETRREMAEIFVGPKLVKGSADEVTRQLRKEGRKAFMEGRATA
jgi:hypothetical protein